ncbi:MAG: hypothetical protein ABSD42_10500 [Candidatus Bathyarchaeia archaeon]
MSCSLTSCPYCGSGSIVGNGYTKRETKRYRCKNCKRTFVSSERRQELLKKSILSELKYRQLAERLVGIYGESILKIF